MRRWEKGLWMVGGTLLGGFMLMQFIPIWEFVPTMDPRNPPVQYEIRWASDEADSIMRMVCYTCHSNETEYPIYAQIAPVSWIAAEHVNEGRQHLNFSEQPTRHARQTMISSAGSARRARQPMPLQRRKPRRIRGRPSKQRRM